MFLFTKQHEELVGIYASQLARHRCIDLFVHMMELRLNSRYLPICNADLFSLIFFLFGKASMCGISLGMLFLFFGKASI